MADSHLFSERALAKLRGISRAAARACDTAPERQRFLGAPPDLDSVSGLVEKDGAEALRALRQMRQAVLIHTAFGEAEGRSPLWAAALWTRFADAAVVVADALAYRDLTARFGVPRTDDGDEVGRAVFALGKLGSGELNPSSDIDLLFAYGTDKGSAGDLALHDFFSRWARRVRDALSSIDEHGFVFRVDLDLRPEGRGGPLVNSVDALESYYETFGLTWERIALIRMRAIVSTQGIADDVNRRLRPFVFPRSPDPRVVGEMGEMRARVDATAPSEGFDVKRSPGGIRDVEFLVQVLQHLHGRRHPELQGGTILDVLHALETLGLVPNQDAIGLERAYLLLRRIEHALQYGEDRQTQFLDDGTERDRVAAALFPGPSSRARFDAALAESRGFARERFEALFGQRPEVGLSRARLALDRTALDAEREAALGEMGFSDPQRALEYLGQLARRPASPFSPRQLSARPGAAAFAARLLDECARSPAPMTALSRLPDLFSGYVPRTLVEHLEAEPRFSNLLLRVLGVSSSLARLMTRHAGVLDALLDARSVRRRAPGSLEDELAQEEREVATDPERAVIAMRRFHARHTLTAALGFLDGRLGVVSSGHRLTALADAILRRALALAEHMLAERYGRPADGRLAVLGLGRQGSREMGFHSDLDLLFVYEGEGETDGPKPVGVAEWASRVAQKTIWILTAPMTDGPCYEVDTRLRPSGNQGPLCTSRAGFDRYHAGESMLWERQSLLRMRHVAGDRSLGVAMVEAARRAAFSRRERHIGLSLLDMRARMVKERVRGIGGFDLKLGEGGIADVEFAVQGLLLAHGPDDPTLWCPSTRRALKRLAARGHLSAADARLFRRTLDDLGTLREAVLLFDETLGGAVSADDHRLALIARMGGLLGSERTAEALFRHAVEIAATVRERAGNVFARLA